MTTKTTRSKPAPEMYHDLREQVRALLDGLNAEVDAHERRAAGRVHYGHVGDMGHVAERLLEVYRTLRNDENATAPAAADLARREFICSVCDETFIESPADVDRIAGDPVCADCLSEAPDMLSRDATHGGVR